MNHQPYINATTDTSYIFVFENIFEDWLENYGCNQLSDQSFKYNTLAGPYDPNKKWFGCLLFDDNLNFISPNIPSFFELVVEVFKRKLLPQIDPHAIFLKVNRAIINGMLPSTPGGTHQDDEIHAGAWASVYFVNDSDGDLIFFDGPNSDKEVFRVKYKKGTLILFPGCYYHCALAPTSDFRITLGTTFTISTQINYDVWGKGVS
jgi:hypothetical protein